MSREEIEAKIKDLEERKFMNQMCDHWSADDYAFDRKCSQEIADLKKELQRMEAENDPEGN